MGFPFAELLLAGVLGVLLTLFQPEGVHYAHPISASTPRFQNLTTAVISGMHVTCKSLTISHVMMCAIPDQYINKIHSTILLHSVKFACLHS